MMQPTPRAADTYIQPKESSMSEKSAFLKALTPEAKACLGKQMFQIPRYPFRVGGESRRGIPTQFADSRRAAHSEPNNDVYLRDPGPLLNVSREHFQIELRGEDHFLVDRGSACGTLLEGAIIGKNRTGGEKRLDDGDVIIVGTSASLYVFKFLNAA
ncbi:hypothetical protein CLG94_09960 [Candidatus Methylomirabilis limnetica]|jgi:pSer/pThr/pTyr-binding forkhead associated (FHA) protein|uniref:FHA domain-containing protein n=2 Tax=Candidatus Methylomirabilis limnetica TaxID=2033718 RepID=A0A2T4TW94_9BACT|nr:hypothetical protein CLG94_09960 [Candidatus Methylomirabilis limnetica]